MVCIDIYNCKGIEGYFMMKIVFDIVVGLFYLYERGIVYWDLKLVNVLVSNYYYCEEEDCDKFVYVWSY